MNTESCTGKDVAEIGCGFISDITQAFCLEELRKRTKNLGRDWKAAHPEYETVATIDFLYGVRCSDHKHTQRPVLFA
jgi:hypothetical protein